MRWQGASWIAEKGRPEREVIYLLASKDGGDCQLQPYQVQGH